MSLADRDYMRTPPPPGRRGRRIDLSGFWRSYPLTATLLVLQSGVGVMWALARASSPGDSTLLDLLLTHFTLDGDVASGNRWHVVVTSAVSVEHLWEWVLRTGALYFFGTTLEARYRFRPMLMLILACLAGSGLALAFSTIEPGTYRAPGPVFAFALAALVLVRSRRLNNLKAPAWIAAAAYLIVDGTGLLRVSGPDTPTTVYAGAAMASLLLLGIEHWIGRKRRSSSAHRAIDDLLKSR